METESPEVYTKIYKFTKDHCNEAVTDTHIGNESLFPSSELSCGQAMETLQQWCGGGGKGQGDHLATMPLPWLVRVEVDLSRQKVVSKINNIKQCKTYSNLKPIPNFECKFNANKSHFELNILI